MFESLISPDELRRLARRRHRLAVHELSRQHVLQKGKNIRPFVPPGGFRNDPGYPTIRPDLEFSLWEMFHAAKKVELLRPNLLTNPSWAFLGFFVENLELLAPGEDLRLNPGGARLYGDFSAAGLAGRIAQGLTVLFMERRGYVYLERLESLIARSQGRIDRPNPTAQIIGVRGWPIPAKTPDFIFEKRDLTQSRALAVSGGVKVA